MNAGGLPQIKGTNLNTYVVVAGFALTLFVGIWNASNNYAQINSFVARQEDYNKNLDADRRSSRAIYDTKLNTLVDTVTKQVAVSDQATIAIGQLQKKDEDVDARMGRMSDTYSNQFTEMRASLADLKTGQVLQNQMLTELRQVWFPTKPPREPTQGQ